MDQFNICLVTERLLSSASLLNHASPAIVWNELIRRFKSFFARFSLITELDDALAILNSVEK